MARFLVQWYESERRGRSHVPIAFWWLSIAGGCSLLLYAWLRAEPVLFFAQMLGLPVYARNLWLIYARRARVKARRAERAPACPQCKYSLRGIESERCPECGFDLCKLAQPTSMLADPQPPIPTPTTLDASPP